MIKTITSRQNEIIKTICSLHSKKGRDRENQFIAQGTNACQALLQAHVPLIQLYATEELRHDAQMLLNGDSEKNIDKLTLVGSHIMEKISPTKNENGIIGVFKKPKNLARELLHGAGLVLARVSDPGNVGTLIRTCAAMNIKNVFLIEGCDPWSSKVVQATAGTIGNVAIAQVTWEELLELKNNRALCALVPTDGALPESIKNKEHLLVVGNEATGIPTQWLATCDEKITIKMPGNIESLNAAVAGSIAIYLTARL